MKTFKFNLPSGIQCVVKELTGEQERILTEQSKNSHLDNLEEMLASCITQIGSDTQVTVEKVKRMLSEDKKAALVTVRQFTMGDVEQDEDGVYSLFEYNFTYTENGKKSTYTHVERIPENAFPFEPTKKLLDGVVVEANWTELSDIEPHYMVDTETYGPIRMERLTSRGERIGAATKKAERSSHTLLKMRNPVRFVKTEKGETPVQVDLDKMSAKDLKKMREAIKTFEGQVHTEIMFEHPLADKLPEAEKWVTVDVMNSIDFFFPGGL